MRSLVRAWSAISTLRLRGPGGPDDFDPARRLRLRRRLFQLAGRQVNQIAIASVRHGHPHELAASQRLHTRACAGRPSCADGPLARGKDFGNLTRHDLAVLREFDDALGPWPRLLVGDPDFI